MSDETKTPRLKVGSVWRHMDCLSQARLRVTEEMWNGAPVIQRADRSEKPFATAPDRLYRLATDHDLLATGTYEDEPKPEPFEDSAFGDFLRGLYERHRRDATVTVGPKQPRQSIEIDVKVDVSHLVKHLHRLDGYVKGYKDAIEGKPAHLKMEETTPCDE